MARREHVAESLTRGRTRASRNATVIVAAAALPPRAVHSFSRRVGRRPVLVPPAAAVVGPPPAFAAIRSSVDSATELASAVPLGADLDIAASFGVDVDVAPSPPSDGGPRRPADREGREDPDRRPHEQRVSGPRKARRMNHRFQHLYRHEDPPHYPTYENVTLLENVSAADYLIRYGGYGPAEVEEMNRTFPPLLDLDVRRHLHPKMRFLKHTLGGVVGVGVSIGVGVVEQSPGTTKRTELALPSSSSGEDDAKQSRDVRTLTDLGQSVPPQYYGARLERTVAPRHAFFVHARLPNGHALLEDGGRLCREFLVSSRRTKQFCALCNTWRRKFGVYDPEETLSPEEKQELLSADVTPRQVEEFDSLFQRGLLAAARDDDGSGDDGGERRKGYVNVTSAQMIRLLLRHGANPLERDVRGVSLVHWAAGCGNIDALRELVGALPGGVDEAVRTKADRDSATPLHWAAAGAGPKEFGTGGHIDVCRYILENCDDGKDERNVVNALTKDGNSVLMWAAWSSTLDVVKLLVRHRADAAGVNRNGCSVAHWAASGGNVEVCRYLADTIGVDFTEPNYAGNTPLSHAVAYGRADVVRWLREELRVDDGRATELARDFIGWAGGEERRRAIFDLFRDDDWYSTDGNEEQGEPVEPPEIDGFL